jgi:hypothetical protein
MSSGIANHANRRRTLSSTSDGGRTPTIDHCSVETGIARARNRPVGTVYASRENGW